MNKKYLIPIKNGFLVYEPKSDIVYRGSRKTMENKHVLTVACLTTITTPILDALANCFWPFLNTKGHIMGKYTILMIISGVIYYKCVYKKNKEKLFQSQLEKINLIDIKEHILKNTVKSFIISVLLIGIVFFICLYGLVYIGNLDPELYMASMISYVICIPILFIESALKGRFLLIKHLLKMSQSK